MRYRYHSGKCTTLAAVSCSRSSSSGFTLLELVVVAGLIGTLSMIVIPRLFGYAERVRDSQAIVDIADMDADIAQYIMDNNVPPVDLNVIGRGGLTDPWGRPYAYLQIEGNPSPTGQRKDHFLVPVNSDFDLYSLGPDGKTGAPFTAAAARDDIVRASNGSFIGPVSEF